MLGLKDVQSPLRVISGQSGGNGRGQIVPKTRRKRRFTSTDMTTRPSQPVNKEQENKTLMGRCDVTSSVHSMILFFLKFNELMITHRVLYTALKRGNWSVTVRRASNCTFIVIVNIF